MEIVESILGLVKNVFLGFLGLVGAVFLFVLIFGKRVEKSWEFEAEFFSHGGLKEIGEFDVEMLKFKDEEGDPTLKIKFHLRHPELKAGALAQVYLDDQLVLEGTVEEDGKVRLGIDDLKDPGLKNPANPPVAGQTCSVKCSGIDIISAELLVD